MKLFDLMDVLESSYEVQSRLEHLLDLAHSIKKVHYQSLGLDGITSLVIMCDLGLQSTSPDLRLTFGHQNDELMTPAAAASRPHSLIGGECGHEAALHG